jgi:hypothetical protein
MGVLRSLQTRHPAVVRFSALREPRKKPVPIDDGDGGEDIFGRPRDQRRLMIGMGQKGQSEVAALFLQTFHAKRREEGYPFTLRR